MKEEKEAVIIVDNIEFRKKDIQELIDYFYKIQSAYAQSELDCSQFKKLYLKNLEENEKLKQKIKNINLKE